MMTRRAAAIALAAIFMAVTELAANAKEARFVLATTTSTENSGLLDHVISRFSKATGVRVDVVAVGTGQALAIGARGDAAALLTHDRAGEDTFVSAGNGADRRDVMRNDFVIIGPVSDPAGLGDQPDMVSAMQRLRDAEAIFISRGDDSGTHRRERRLWQEAGLDPENFGAWYREAGAGMGQTLLTATQADAYTLSDRGTWIAFARKTDHAIVYENMPPLLNPYSSILVAHPALREVEISAARAWHVWLTGPDGQAAINSFRVQGQQLFFAGD
ncbi:MAG: substrate-binding domain-containing protein [Pseudomonadota bacterium]